MLVGGLIVRNNNNKNKLEKSPDSFEIQIARLVYIGSTISTIGGGLQTLAAALALNALEKANSQDSQSSQTRNEQSKQPEDLEMQIDSIIKELKQIKRMMK